MVPLHEDAMASYCVIILRIATAFARVDRIKQALLPYLNMNRRLDIPRPISN